MNNPQAQRYSPAAVLLGLVFIAIGIGVFAVRLSHAGPYAMPHGGALYGALGAIALGTLLIGLRRLHRLGWIAVLVSPLALFPAIYSIMGESEEVISLYATNTNDAAVDLRLWIVDKEQTSWVGMPRTKAVDHSLHGARLDMLRSGQRHCVVPILHEDRETVRAIHAMKVAKYAVARMAGAIGLYPLEAPETTVVLRLDPCPQP